MADDDKIVVKGKDQDGTEVTLIFEKKPSEGEKPKTVTIDPGKPVPKSWEKMTTATIEKKNGPEKWPFHPEEKGPPPTPKVPPFPDDTGSIAFLVDKNHSFSVSCHPAEKPKGKDKAKPAGGNIHIQGWGVPARDVAISKEDQNKLLKLIDAALT